MKNILYQTSFIFILVIISLNLSAQQSFSFTAGATLNDFDVKTLTKEIEIEGEVNSLTLSVNIVHTWVNDLEMTITNPEGVQAMVFSRLGDGQCFGCDGDDIHVLFKDTSPQTYEQLNQSCGDAPAYQGESMPLESLDALLSGNINGVWRVDFRDYWPQEKGMVNEVIIEFGKYELPLCASNIIPNTTDVAINSLLTWDASPNATGYYINLGTSLDANDIIDKLDVGNVSSYDPGLLECGADYYLQVIPYNIIGEAVDCEMSYFSTEDVIAISSGDMEICRGDFVSLAGEGGSVYEWFPQDYLDNPNSQYPISTTQESISYFLVVFNENGCSDTTEVSILVNSVDIKVDSIFHVRTGMPGFIHISVNDDLDDYTYSWTGPNGFIANSEDIDNLEVGCYELEVKNMVTSCVADTTLCIDDLTDLKNFLSLNTILVYPNPVNSKLTIDFGNQVTETWTIELFTLTGKSVIRTNKNKSKSKVDLDTSPLPLGSYYLLLKSGREVITERIEVLN